MYLFLKRKRAFSRSIISYNSSNPGQDNAGVVDFEEEEHDGLACDLPCRNLDPKVSALFEAIQRQDTEDVQKLLSDSPPGWPEKACNGLTPLLVACYLRNLEILRLLLHHHAQVEAEDSHGSTPLHTAICDGWDEGVEELLKHGASPELRNASTSSTTKCFGETPLKAAVRTGNVEALQLIFSHHPNISLAGSEEGTLLHLAARVHQTEVVSFLLEKTSAEILKSHSQKGDNVIHAVLQKNGIIKDEQPILGILRMFFEAGVDVNWKNNAGETPLFLASRRRLPKCTELLLSFGADPLAITDTGQSVLHGACRGGCAVTLNHLLSTRPLAHLVTAPDKEGKLPFHHAVGSSSIDCCKILLNNGDHLTYMDVEGTSRCSLLLQYFPSTSSTQLLTRLFDSYITLSDDPQSDRNFHVVFDYSEIMFKNNSDIQRSLIEDINNLRKDLLEHPLLESLVHLKWGKVRFTFYSMLLTYFAFIILHTIYILGTNTMASETGKQLANLWAFRVLHLVMYCLILWPEIITIIANPSTYLRHWETLTKTISLVASAIVVFSHQYASMNAPISSSNITMSQDNTTEHTNSSIHFGLTKEIGAISVFFGWIELMMLCGRLPILGSHVLMFARIAKSAIKFIAAFVGLLIGFSVSFMVLFSDKDEFSTFGASFVKTLMMMIGEVDYSNLVDRNTAIISYLILIVFLFLVCILMANLLIGLAVDDIYNLQRIGNIERRSKQATHIGTYVKVISVAKRFHLLPRRLIYVLIRLYETKSQKKIFPNKNSESLSLSHATSIPSKILQEALSIANANKASNNDPPVLSEKKMSMEENCKLLLQKLEDIRNMMIDNDVKMTRILKGSASDT